MEPVTELAGQPTTILITRVPFGEWFTLELSNGHTEELEPDECRKWFKDRGANMDVIEKALDHCWNFQRSEVVVANFKEPVTAKNPYAPNLDRTI